LGDMIDVFRQVKGGLGQRADQQPAAEETEGFFKRWFHGDRWSLV